MSDLEWLKEYCEACDGFWLYFPKDDKSMHIRIVKKDDKWDLNAAFLGRLMAK